jgi:hypothetical protein
MSWDSLFIDIITHWYESETPDREIINSGELLGIKHIKIKWIIMNGKNL